MILKKFDQPTDVFIVPSFVYKDGQYTGDALITDDEHDFVITMDNRIQHRLTSNGFVSVLSKEEFLNNIDSFSEELIDGDFIMLPNFQGEVGVKVVFILEGEQNIHIDELDLDEYLMHQEGFSEYHDRDNHKSTEYCITVPKGTETCLGRYNEDKETWEVQTWAEI